MTEKQKHTPGPWHVVRMPGWGDSKCISRFTQSQTSETIGDCPIAKIIEGNMTREGVLTWKHPSAENARLIAAAPEMYEALVSIVRGTKPDYDLVKAVLDKIEKENPDEAN